MSEALHLITLPLAILMVSAVVIELGRAWRDLDL